MERSGEGDAVQWADWTGGRVGGRTEEKCEVEAGAGMTKREGTSH